MRVCVCACVRERDDEKIAHADGVMEQVCVCVCVFQCAIHKQCGAINWCFVSFLFIAFYINLRFRGERFIISYCVCQHLLFSLYRLSFIVDRLLFIVYRLSFIVSRLAVWRPFCKCLLAGGVFAGVCETLVHK